MITCIAIGGIVLTAIGSLILVLATVRAPRFMQLPEFQFGHMRRVETLHKAMRQGYENYPEEEREEAYSAAEKKYDEAKQEVEAKIATAFYADMAQTRIMNLVGILLIALGSVAQGIGVLMA